MFEFLSNLVGKKVIFHAFDGNDYEAKVLKVEAGCVKIEYSAIINGVSGIAEPIEAYICEPERIDLLEVAPA